MRASRPPDGRSARRAVRGFTLVEMMTVVAIIAILVTVAAPSFAELVATQRVRAATSALTESLWLARAEATKRNTAVGFEFTDPRAGWTIPDPAGSTTPLLVQAGFETIEFTSQSGDSVRLTFNAYGRLSTGGGWVQVGDPHAGVYRCVTVSSAGRASTAKGPCQ
jgi:type IV fimbrial biogenesis protein FimT